MVWGRKKNNIFSFQFRLPQSGFCDHAHQCTLHKIIFSPSAGRKAHVKFPAQRHSMFPFHGIGLLCLVERKSSSLLQHPWTAPQNVHAMKQLLNRRCFFILTPINGFMCLACKAEAKKSRKLAEFASSSVALNEEDVWLKCNNDKKWSSQLKPWGGRLQVSLMGGDKIRRRWLRVREFRPNV